MPATILLSTPVEIINTAVGAGVNGSAFAMPVPACMIAWQVFYGTPPGSNTINLQASNDGITWSTIDNTASVASGNLRITQSSARFIRINMSAVAGGDTFRVLVSASALGIGKGEGTFVASQAIQVATTAVVTEEVLWQATISARSLSQTGRAIRLRWAGKTAANANVKTGRVRFGGDNYVLFNSGINNVDWTGEFIVMRRSFGIQIRRGISNLNAVAPGVQVLAIAVDETQAITFQLTGQNGVASAGDITLEWVILDTIPAIPNLIS